MPFYHFPNNFVLSFSKQFELKAFRHEICSYTLDNNAPTLRLNWIYGIFGFDRKRVVVSGG